MTERFADIRTAVVKSLKTEFPRLRSVKSHGGPVNLDEMVRFTLRTPQALVAWVGTTVSRDRVQRATGESTFAVYIVTKDLPRRPAPDEAMKWADRITEFIDGNKFGLDFIHSAQVYTNENHYDTDTDVKGFALIEIRFETKVILEGEGIGEGDNEEYTDEQRDIVIMRRSMSSPHLGNFEAALSRTAIHNATATVRTIGGVSEINQVALTSVSATHEFTIPYVNLGIDMSCDVQMGSRLFEIKDIENVNEQNRELILRCAALGSQNKAAN